MVLYLGAVEEKGENVVICRGLPGGLFFFIFKEFFVFPQLVTGGVFFDRE